MKKTILTILGIAALAGPTMQAQIVTFTTTGLSSGASNPSSIAPNFVAGNLTTGNLTKGPGLTTGSGGANIFYGSSWGNSTTNSNLASGIADGNFFTFTITPESGYFLSLSTLDHRVYRTQAGANNWQWEYAVGNGTFTSIGSPLQSLATSTTTAAQTQISLSSIIALQDVTSTVTFRMVGWVTDLTGDGGGNPTGGGNLGFASSGTSNANSDALVFGGNVTVVPEPSSVLLLALGVLGMMGMRRRR